MSRRAPASALIILIALSCSQRVEPEADYVDGESGRPTLPAEMTPPALMGGDGRAAMAQPAPGGGASGPGAAAAPAPDAIRGVVRAPAEAAAPAGAVLFLYVRQAGVTGGPPLAVQRHAADALPLEFAIGTESAMIPGSTFPDRVTVEARLDQDGNAMTESPDDWSARSAPLAAGATGVELPLARP